MKKAIALLLVFCFCTALASCNGKSEPEESTTEKEYNIPTPVVTADISLPYTSADKIDPYASKSEYNRDLLSAIYEGLFAPSKDGKATPLLASSGDIEKTNVTVKLKQGITFSDGTEVIASTVKNSFDLASSSAYYKSNLSNIASVKIIDNYTLSLTLYHHDDLILNALNFPIVSGKSGSYIGTGKYVLKDLEGKPYLIANENNRDYIKDGNAEINLYDMAGVSSPVYPFKANDISIYKDNLSDGKYTNLSSQTISVPTNRLVYAGLNMNWQGSVLSVPCVRQAINIGINRSTVAASAFLGQNDATALPYRNECYLCTGLETAPLTGSIERAVNILEKGGYNKENSEGIRTNGTSSLRVSILVCSANPYKVDVAESLKATLEAIGFGVTINEKKTAAYKEALEDGHFDIYIGETQLSDNCDLSEFFSKNGTVNYGISEDTFEIYNSYRSGKTSFSQFAESFCTEVPFIPLFFRNAVLSVNPNISNVILSTTLFGNLDHWHFENENS